MNELLNMTRLIAVVATIVVTLKVLNHPKMSTLSGSVATVFHATAKVGAFGFGVFVVFMIGMGVFVGLGGTVTLPGSIQIATESSSPGYDLDAMPAASNGVNWSNVPAAVARWRVEIVRAADQCGVDPALLAALVAQESAGDETICSSVGACGLTQLMPATAREMRVTNRLDPAQSLMGGACYLRKQIDRYGGDMRLGLAAYNAGAGNVDKHGGVPPFKETQDYVRIVPAKYEAYRAQTGKAGRQVPAFNDVSTASLSSVAPQSATCCIWPVSAGDARVTSFPTTGHTAYDIAAPIGTPILAAHEGVVVTAGTHESYGRFLIIEHREIRTLYAHLESLKVSEGQRVSKGQKVGGMGTTGKSTGVHLHFEVYQNREIVDPTPFLPPLK